MPSPRIQRPLETAVFQALSKWIAEYGDLPFTRGNDLGLSAALLTDALHTGPSETQVLFTLAAGGVPTEWSNLQPLAHQLVELRERYGAA
jgi:hypothetical protein